MELNLAGRRALVCGSSQGIGLAAAAELASLGATVTLLARDQARLEAALQSLPAVRTGVHTIIRADSTQPISVRDAAAVEVAAGGPYHILVNNTGGPAPGPITDAAPEQFLAAFGMHVVCAQLLVQLLLPGMKAAKFGRVVNIISTSVKQPIPNLGVSNTIRAAMASWAKTLSQEVGPFGITVNNVLPGYTETERLAALVKGRAAKQGATEAQVAAELIATIPAGRFGTAAEVGGAVAFLATPAAAYINGINLPVDGGRLGSL